MEGEGKLSSSRGSQGFGSCDLGSDKAPCVALGELLIQRCLPEPNCPRAQDPGVFNRLLMEIGNNCRLFMESLFMTKGCLCAGRCPFSRPPSSHSWEMFLTLPKRIFLDWRPPPRCLVPPSSVFSWMESDVFMDSDGTWKFWEC